MKIHLLSRIRNERDIIADSILHWKGVVNGSIVIYDDCSTDDTRTVVSRFEGVTLIEGKEHHKDRDYANYWCREQALSLIRKRARPGDWVVCADADERFEINFDEVVSLRPHIKAVAVRLFDYYITPDDVGKGWKARAWIGPEFRDIVMIWRHDPRISFNKPSQRVPSFPFSPVTVQMGYCHHYGKARSVQHWETKCKYYQGQFSAQPAMKAKWKGREGKAIKTDYESDFGLPLIRWEDRATKGVKLTKEIHRREFA